MGVVEVAVHPSDLGPEHALQGHRGHVDHGHVRPELAGGGRDLGPDPAGADDHDGRSDGDGSVNGVAVCHRAQQVEPLQLHTRDVGPPRRGACRQEQPLEASTRTAPEPYLRGRHV